MELAELARRRTFEKDISRILRQDLEKDEKLLNRVAMYSGISKSHDLALEALPKRIESQSTVVSQSQPKNRNPAFNLTIPPSSTA